MESTISCFIPYTGVAQAEKTVQGLQATDLVKKIYLLATSLDIDPLPGCELLYVDKLTDSVAMYAIAERPGVDCALLYTKHTALELGMFALERMIHVTEDPGAGMVYVDHYQVAEDRQSNAPVIGHQFGSLRDDSDSGFVLLFKAPALREAIRGMETSYDFASLYDLRLKLSQEYPLVHIDEYLYSEIENDIRKNGEKIFDYVGPKNHKRQVEMGATCTGRLKEIGGYLKPEFEKVEFSADNFEYEASVIIPARNHIRTIRDAIRSVLSQKTKFRFNLIVINSRSTDGVTKAIGEHREDNRLIHLIPERNDLGIDGCWSLGAYYPLYSKFTMQLDSDDVYAHRRVLQLMINAFYEQNCVMVVDAYMMTDFDMNVIPPGVIDHREWIPENGHDSALRINGLGAPRAFYTPMSHETKMPSTSYGEGYALELDFSHRHQIGRIYEVAYLCRRWDDSSDASLDTVKVNEHSLYKDRIRTQELQARVTLNKKQG